MLALAAASPAQAQAARNPQEPRNLLSNGGFESPPESCVLSFVYSPLPSAAQVSFEVWYGASLMETVVVPGGSPHGWIRKSYSLVGIGQADEVEFRCLTGNPVGVLLDDCSLIPFSPSSSDQLVRNGSFEEDPRLPAGGTLENPVCVGWSTAAHYDILAHDLGAAGNGFEGKNVLHLREGRAITQQLFVVPLQSYQLTFAYSPNPGDDRQRSFSVSFAGQLLETITVPRSAAIGWSVRAYSVSSAAPMAALEFEDHGGGPVGCFLDAVRLVGPVPEPETAGQVSQYSTLARGTAIPLGSSAMFARGITYGASGFTDTATFTSDYFGMSCANMGDSDQDGVNDVLTGAFGRRIHFMNFVGAQYLMLLNRRRDREALVLLRLREPELSHADARRQLQHGHGVRGTRGRGRRRRARSRHGSPARGRDLRPRARGEHEHRGGLRAAARGGRDSWDFGDGTGSSLRAASHTYGASGTYSARLTVRGSDGTSDTKTLVDFVNVAPGGGLPDGVVKLGCGVNPSASLRILAGSPRIGTSMTFGIDNPFGTQAAGSIPLLVGSWSASPRFPCGTLQANRGMSAPRKAGELLIAGSLAFSRRGSAWAGPGNPAPVVYPIPNLTSLLGRTLYVQGRLQDRSLGAAIPLAFADGFALTFRP